MAEEKKDSKNPLKSLRTYIGDVQEALKKNKTSASSIIIAEQNRRNRLLTDTKEQFKAELKNKSFLILGSILLLAGIGTIFVVYYLKSNEKSSVVEKVKPLIIFTAEKDLNIASSTREQLVATMTTEKRVFKSAVNSVLYLNMTNPDGTVSEISDVLKIITPRMPDPLKRSFEGKYMFGAYSFDTNEPFIILTTEDFATSYSGMLKWESAIVSDLKEFFSIDQSLSTTTVFGDETLRNKDLRILKDKNKNIILLYSFVDKNTLIITTHENILIAILGKYITNKLSR